MNNRSDRAHMGNTDDMVAGPARWVTSRRRWSPVSRKRGVGPGRRLSPDRAPRSPDRRDGTARRNQDGSLGLVAISTQPSPYKEQHTRGLNIHRD